MKKSFIVVFIIISAIFLFVKSLFTKDIITSVTQETNEELNQSGLREFTLISTGDIGLVRDVNLRIIQKNDPNYPFLKIASYLRDADITVINLEGPLIKDCPVIVTGFKFCGNLSNAKGLRYAGIDAVSLANNHTTNYGSDGLQQTISILEKEGMIPYGVGNSVKYTPINGHRIALVGFVELGNNWERLNNASVENIENLLIKSRETADVVIVSFHWGSEYTHQPTSEMVRLAHLAVDSGADIVLGNHPHWIQIDELYKGKHIIYAQGNTVFDQDWSEKTREGVLYKFLYRDGRFEKIDERYTIIEDNSQPRFATTEETERIKAKIN